MAEVITDNLGLWTSALLTKSTAGRGSNGKLEAYGIKKLRELILELAVRGKLVPQDPDDEPARELLKRVAADKAKMVREGKIRKEKDFPAIAGEEIPFNVPGGWEWARINDVGHDWGQKTPDAKFTYIDVSAIDNSSGVINSPSLLSAADAPSRARKIVAKGTVIYSTVRPYLKNICVIEEDYSPEAIASTAFAVLHPFQGMPGKFFALYFRSPEFVKYVEKVQTGIAYPAINDKQFYGGLVPIPPSAEQHRIVAKVDELMALCDQLEQQQTDSLAAHQTLVETLLGALTRAESQQEFSAAWARIASHFETLFTTEASIDQLKQTILQLAVMGKLVPQEGGWIDTCLGELGTWAVGSGFPISEQGNAGLEILFAKVSDMNLPENAKYIVTTNHTISEATANRLRVNVHAPGTVIFPKIGGAIATNKRRILTRSTAIDNNCLGLAPKRGVSTDWLYLLLSSIDFTQYQAGTSVPALSQGTLSRIPVALPGGAEQPRIVAKVDELMALCDTLKVRLADAQTTQIHLADAIVERAVC